MYSGLGTRDSGDGPREILNITFVLDSKERKQRRRAREEIKKRMAPVDIWHGLDWHEGSCPCPPASHFPCVTSTDESTDVVDIILSPDSPQEETRCSPILARSRKDELRIENQVYKSRILDVRYIDSECCE